MARLLFVQGIDAARYQEAARSEYVQEISYAAERGAVLDRNGEELAMSVPMTTVCADPQYVTDPRTEAVALSGPLGVPVATLEADLSEEGGFVYLAHTIASSAAAEVERLMDNGDLSGIYTIQEPKTFYPAGQLAMPLLGVVGADDQGLTGLEYKYNSVLEGKPGELVEEVAPAGGKVPSGQIPGGPREYKAPVSGNDLVLTIDEPLQYETEEALARAIVAAEAESGMALIMNARTGALLAVAELTMPTESEPITTQEPPALPVWFLPSWDGGGASSSGGGVAGEQPVESPSASALTTVYEPGSVEKLVSISAALASGAITPSEHFAVPDSYNVAGTAITDAWPHATLDWTASDILAHSSDIGTVEIAQQLGMAKLMQYMYAFGIGEKTDIGFPGESSGLVPGPSQWSGTTIATVPIGQGVAVTAIQMLDAYNAIANGGMFIAPRLVEGYVDAKGREHLFRAGASHRVVSEQVARDMTSMLEGVVRVGTGTAAGLEPYTVAGKTGTALVPSPEGGYVAGDFVSSFAGFVPAEDPAITAMVVVEGTHHYGAQVSAPVFATIARDALQDLGIPPHKAEPPPAGVPLASTYGGEGEAAGGPLPGLSGTPNVQVSPQQTGSGTSGAGTSGTASSGAAPTTGPDAVGGTGGTGAASPASSAPGR
jgi:cell division protein FtsI (penicillin-binding protein 3)